MIARIIALLTVALLSPMALAQPAPTAAQHVRDGQTAFEKGDYSTALTHYDAAFALESTPENAVRAFVAATYVGKLSMATGRLDVWLLKKRADAQMLGDADPSWKQVENASRSLKSAAIRHEGRIESLEAQIVDLEQKLRTQTVIVSRIKVDYEKRIADLQKDFKSQLEALRPLDTNKVKP